MSLSSELRPSCMVWIHRPVFASHIFAVLSLDEVIIFSPLGLNNAVTKTSVCPLRVVNNVPVVASQIFAVLS